MVVRSRKRTARNSRRSNGHREKAEPAARGAEPKIEQHLARMITEYRRLPALLSNRQLLKYEQVISHSNSTDNFGTARRSALAVLTRPCRTLMTSIEKDREVALAFLDMYNSLTDYSQVLGQLCSLISEAQRRVMVSLYVRPDFDELAAEARQLAMQRRR